MKNQTENQPTNIIVTFHVGRGGRFNNQGFLRYCGEDHSAKHQVETENYMAFENESEIIQKHGDDVIDLITDLANNPLSDEYKAFCDKYGNLGDVVINSCDGNRIGDYVEDGQPFTYDEDGEYDTTYGIRLEDCDEDQLELIVKSNQYKSSELIDWIGQNSSLEIDEYGNLIEEEIED